MGMQEKNGKKNVRVVHFSKSRHSHLKDEPLWVHFSHTLQGFGRHKSFEKHSVPIAKKTN